MVAALLQFQSAYLVFKPLSRYNRWAFPTFRQPLSLGCGIAPEIALVDVIGPFSWTGAYNIQLVNIFRCIQVAQLLGYTQQIDWELIMARFINLTVDMVWKPGNQTFFCFCFCVQAIHGFFLIIGSNVLIRADLAESNLLLLFPLFVPLFVFVRLVL